MEPETIQALRDLVASGNTQRIGNTRIPVDEAERALRLYDGVKSERVRDLLRGMSASELATYAFYLEERHGVRL